MKDQCFGIFRPGACRLGGWLLVAAWLAAAPAAFGKNNWFTARTVNDQTWPISAGTAATAVERFRDISTIYVTNGLIDIVISLYNNPRGDDDGRTQGNPGSEEQDNYEYIVQYFADGIYEATEGCHALRNVRIYRGGQRPDADVTWTAIGHPNARSLNTSGQSAWLCMYDVFADGTNVVAVYTNSADHEVGGYCLTHEWGHYAYGLFDEYCRWNGSDWTNLPAIDKVQPSVMNSQRRARNRNYSWLNYSIRWQGHGTNGVDDFVPYENRLRGAQHQLQGNSCWGTLRNNPINDPTGTAYQRRFRQRWGQRIHYPELATVAPAGTNPPQINLSRTAPLDTLPSRRSLNIIWMGSNNIALELVVDRSGSMSYNSKMSRAKTAAKLLVDQVSDGSAVGVVDFDSTVTVLYPVTLVTNIAVRESIKSAIDTLTPGDYTAMGDAAQTALNELNAFGHSNMTKSVFLLSDGYSNEGIDPLEVCLDYANAQVPLMAFCLGKDWDNRLPLMAWATGGESFSALTNLQNVVESFRQAYAVAAARPILAQGNAAAAAALAFKASGNINIPFTVDAALSDISVVVGYSTSNTVAVTLNSPDGVVYHASSTNDADSERVLFFAVSAPVPGVWSIAGSAASDADLWYQAEAGVKEFTYHLTASAAGQNVVSFPAPLEIVACLGKTRSINGAVVTAQITETNDSTTVSLVLSNNAPGSYSAFYPATNGLYTVVVRADNSAGTAYLTSAETAPTANDEDVLPEPTPDEAITESFSRTVTFQVTVTNVPEELAVPAAPVGVSASDGDYANEVLVAWSAVTNAQVYEIWRHTGDQSGNAIKLAEVDYAYTNYFDSSAANGVMYYYWVKANNIMGSGAFGGSDAGWRQAFPPVADYDGDGKADPGVYNQPADEWRLRLSACGYAFFVSTLDNLCAGEDRPLAADFDGDRLADPATYQETSGDWKVMLSSSGYGLITLSAFLGGSGYTPIAADFDADRLADPAVYQASTGNWQTKLSAGGYALATLEAFGGSGYLAVPADYDGDGRADPAVYQLSTGTWIVMMSGSGYSRLEVHNLLGGSGWIPAVGDYDGDAKADPTVRNESGNEWIVMLSSNGYTPVHVTLSFE